MNYGLTELSMYIRNCSYKQLWQTYKSHVHFIYKRKRLDSPYTREMDNSVVANERNTSFFLTWHIKTHANFPQLSKRPH